ncbi:MAG: abhydrolase domain-containing 18 [Actinobacteria bacterium]|nr:abhydrolase domain-containing 18 [Actinomycetota bacterium]
MHWLDAVSARALARIPPHQRVFRRGWGDPEALAAYLEEAAVASPLPDIPVAEGPERPWNGLAGRDLTFESPGRYLPEPSRLARARLLLPPEGAERAVVLMAAWNDHGYEGRAKLAAALAARGIASAMLEQPFYGARRPLPGDPQPITTVAEFMWMGRSAVLEGRVLADYLRRKGFRVGVGGYSMGGNMAGFLAAALPFPVAPALLAASFSPGPPFLHGILRNTIDWEALGGDTPQGRQRLADILFSASVLRFPAPAHTRAAVLVAGTRDGYVPTAAAQAVHRHWPGSELEWVNAGHASLLWFHRDRLVAAVVRAFERLERASLETPPSPQPSPAPGGRERE